MFLAMIFKQSFSESILYNMSWKLFVAVILLCSIQTYEAKNCYCSKILIKFDVHGLPLSISFELNKDNSGEYSVYKTKGENAKFLFKSSSKWHISSKVDVPSEPSVYSHCTSNCPHDCPRWNRQAKTGSEQSFSNSLISATCEGNLTKHILIQILYSRFRFRKS